ncbi:hypothetical protein AVEN_157570-1 [Araneus ventricosus]|uniref:Myb-like domain-containing protein n=2 Tax=Araneus ventricosus TaxID=182803 RepID=A0A4Y2HJ32_ARAVE|nr:hypothetical protein AVEN_157570-1 [Araneus ventricosus]
MPKTYQNKRGCGHWSDRELTDLAAGLQKYGFADPQKISSVIKTKSATSVKVYIQRKIDEIRKEKHKLEKETNGRKVRKSWNVTNAEDVKDWRTVRKWRKIAENQMPLSAVRQDYSRIIIQNLCEKFYDEAKEATNPQVLDVKSIYKFMLECVSGQIPSQLPIKESTYVLVLLRFMKDMFQKYDFQEEHQFIHSKNPFDPVIVFNPLTVLSKLHLCIELCHFYKLLFNLSVLS